LGYLEGGPRKISPFFVPSNIINMIAGNLSIKYGIKGPNYGIVSACSTGTHNIGDAARMIERGDVDVMIAGGSEMATSPMGLGGFAAARALSTRNDAPERLEAYEYARKRGARIYAEFAGFGMSSDAFHITLPSEDGDGARRCMLNAIKDARMEPEQIDYINAHGTSTPSGDVVESRAVEQALGDHATKVAISSTKSMIGHLLGAAGGVEAVFSILSIRDQVAPPTINLDEPGDGCRLDYVPHEARSMKIDVVMSNSFGFGGTNGTLIFKKVG
jgi:3-oxoacyl-[acyl-carrier-protein] synthase II